MQRRRSRSRIPRREARDGLVTKEFDTVAAIDDLKRIFAPMFLRDIRSVEPDKKGKGPKAVNLVITG